VKTVYSTEEFYTLLDQEKQQLDCLILQNSVELPTITQWLYGRAIVLPALILNESAAASRGSADSRAVGATPFIYHTAEVQLAPSQLEMLNPAIDRAIAQFIDLSPTCRIETAPSPIDRDLTTQNFLLLKQRHLTEKLKERLGYLSFYFKRSPQNFLRNLPPEQKQETIDRFRADYREIVLCYFANDDRLNQRIDNFVDAVFFTDTAVSQVVEIHMELMDEFSKQLKIEGRSEDILLDYRLTLIDVIAHLCEMYRRSIPKEGQME
jgi:circadian clock protein KaiA